MPEGLQDGPAGQLLESRYESLGEWIDTLQDALDGVEGFDAAVCCECGEFEESENHDLTEEGEADDPHEFDPESPDLGVFLEGYGGD